MTERKADTRDLVDDVHSELRELIISGALGPGARIIERAIAQRLGVSRTPVRHAISRLQHEGLVIPNPAERYARPVVAPLTIQDADSLHELLGWLDAGCAEKAARLDPRLRNTLADRMARHNRSFAHRVRGHRLEGALASDDAMHSVYVDAVAGERVSALRRSTKPHLERYLRSYLPVLHRKAEAAIAEHDRLIEAIRRGAAETARKAALENWNNAAARLRDSIRMAGERGVGALD
jgi:DNA-binding GntR family transcriptional regulator